jgi:hypothetical protein
VTDTNRIFKIGDLFIDHTYSETVTGLILDIFKTEQGDRITVKWISRAIHICRVWEYSKSDLERKIKLNNAEYYPVIQYEKKCI